MPHVHELSDAELDAHFTASPYRNLWGGALAVAELPKLASKFYICLMSSKAQPNDGHWQLTYNCLPGHVYFFDSFGVAPPPHVQRRMVETGKERVYSSLPEQSLPQIDCGLLCVFVATLLLQKIPFQRILRYYLHPQHFADNQCLALAAWNKNTCRSSATLASRSPSTAMPAAKRRTGAGVRKRKLGGTVRHHAKRCGHKTLDGGSCKNRGECQHHHKRH